MSVARTIPAVALEAQVQAADPEVSAFVSANAGSGKTHVLAQRVINLLLRGVDPAKILCITFTKAAAANMANRVFDTLAKWTALDDDELDAEIRLGGRKPDAARRARARRLFASALETPGGLKVQTIHAFCTRLLHQFPFEANVGARFAVVDEAATAQLLDRLTLDVLLEASAKPESALGQALAAAIVAAADMTFREVIGEAIVERDALSGWIAGAGSIDAAIAELSRSFGIDPNETVADVDIEIFAGRVIADSEWAAIGAALTQGSKTDKEQGARFNSLATLRGTERLDSYLDIFCTKKRDKTKERIATSVIEKTNPDLCRRLNEERARVWDLLQRKCAIEVRERTAALITIAKEVIDRYQAEKERRALLDYEDLIDKTLPLLTDGAASWVHYKLDLGIDHILIDEAQDTSPKQWEIIRLLASEFMPGGARDDVKRTIFAVGDEKQSIFSFQGAAPQAFDEMRRLFERQFSAPELGFRHVRLHHSFRSGINVLGSVDRVFAAREIYESITADAVGMPEHQSLPDAAPGLVEIWPLMEPGEKRDIEGWDAPFDTESEESPRVKLARRIAAQVKRLCARGLKPGDVLILVRQRGPLFEAIIRALKEARVPVAGADRLVLAEHIAVMDLMALADCLLLPDDDLALACVLKSPLFGLSEEQLFELAWDRKSSLRAALRAKAAGDEFFAIVERALDELTQVARNHSPFGFFAHVLGAWRGRKKFLSRLGPEANDALDEFLNLALDYETREAPSLQGFLAFLRAAKSEVKRDMEMARDEVRVMTVHGAKGLEANTVILADTTTDPKGAHPPRLLALDHGALVWAQRKQDDTETMATARAGAEIAERNEYRRLLYVAMTRTAERLIVCGSRGDKKIPDGCWYQLVSNALRDDCVREPADDGDGEILRYRKQPEAPVETRKPESAAAPQVASLPAWLTRAAPSVLPAERSVTPSSALDEDARPAAGASNALLRGALVHRLLQSLPDIPSAQRRAAMSGYLARAGAPMPPEERERIAAQVMRVLEDPRFSELFGPGSRAEVPLVGRIETGDRPIRVSGQVDRLAVTQASIFIADFKTNRLAPRRLEEVPPAYVAQLALYRALLARLYPERPVRAALIWTEVPDLMELSVEMLDAALARVTSA